MFLTSPTTVGKIAPQHPQYASTPCTPSDSVDVSLSPTGGVCRALYVGGAGTVAVVLHSGATATITVGAGQLGIQLVGVTRVLATGTTATSISTLY